MHGPLQGRMHAGARVNEGIGSATSANERRSRKSKVCPTGGGTIPKVPPVEARRGICASGPTVGKRGGAR